MYVGSSLDALKRIPAHGGPAGSAALRRAARERPDLDLTGFCVISLSDLHGVAPHMWAMLADEDGYISVGALSVLLRSLEARILAAVASQAGCANCTLDTNAMYAPKPCEQFKLVHLHILLRRWRKSAASLGENEMAKVREGLMEIERSRQRRQAKAKVGAPRQKGQ